MVDKVLESAKAVAAFVGALVTVLVAVNPAVVPSWVAYVTAGCTFVATYAIPNKPRAVGRHAAADEAGN